MLLRLRTLAVAVTATALLAASHARAQEQNSPITVFVAKQILTMDPGWPTATAVAVRDGKILSVGSLDDLRPWLTSAPYRIDRTFADLVLMPGFVEPHGGHVLPLDALILRKCLLERPFLPDGTELVVRQSAAGHAHVGL